MEDVKLLGREQVATGTQALHFTWPQGFEFKPGQAVDLVIPVGAKRRACSLVIPPKRIGERGPAAAHDPPPRTAGRLGRA